MTAVPRPTQIPEWASGGGLTRIEPDAGEKAAGFARGMRTAAPKANWVLGLEADWVAYVAAIIDSDEEHTYQTAKARLTTISPLLLVPGQKYVAPGGSAADVALLTRWSPDFTVSVGSGPGGRDVVTETGKMRTSLPFHQGLVELGRFFPTGAEILNVNIDLDPGTAQATSTDRMLVELVKRTIGGALTVIASASTNNTANPQTVPLAGLSEVVALNGYSYALRITSSAGASTGAALDYVVGIEINWNDPGPRS